MQANEIFLKPMKYFYEPMKYFSKPMKYVQFVCCPAKDGCIGATGQANVAQGDRWSVGMPFKWIFTRFF